MGQVLNPNPRRQLLATAVAAVVAAIALLAVPVQAIAEPATQELMLYGVKLKDAKVADFTKAALAAGAKRLGKNSFDAKGAGVPGMNSFTLLSAGEDLVGVQFDVAKYGPEGEKLRQMLRAKYGNPSGGDFAGQDVADGTYSWHRFGEGMRLVWRTPFSGGTTLTYIDQPKFDALEAVVKKADAQDTSTKTKVLVDKF